MFKHLQSGEVFRAGSVSPKVIHLATMDGFNSMFVDPNKIESVFVPFTEEELPRKPIKR